MAIPDPTARLRRPGQRHDPDGRGAQNALVVDVRDRAQLRALASLLIVGLTLMSRSTATALSRLGASSISVETGKPLPPRLPQAARGFGYRLSRARYRLGEQPVHLRKAREKDAASSKPSSNPIAFIGKDEFNNMSFASFSFFIPTNEA